MNIISRLHLHPIMVQFPGALFPVTNVLGGLYLLTGNASFEISSFYTLVFGFLATPFALASGFNDWKTLFGGNMTPLFKEKISWGLVLFFLSGIAILLRLSNPDYIQEISKLRYIYMGIILILLPLVMRLGYLGGKLVFTQDGD